MQSYQKILSICFENSNWLKQNIRDIDQTKIFRQLVGYIGENG